MVDVERIKARITELRYKRDRLTTTIIQRKNMLATKLLTQKERLKINAQITTKTKLLHEIGEEMARLAAVKPK